MRGSWANVTVLLALVFSLIACDAPSQTPSTQQPNSDKVARRERTQTLTGTAVSTDTTTPTLVPTATDSPTSTTTATPRATRTPRPTRTLTPDPLTVPRTIGGSRTVPRSVLSRITSPPNLRISPILFGLNYWIPGFDKMWREPLRPLQPVVIRGEITNDDLAHQNYEGIDRFILDCRLLNAEPLIQIPYRYADPDMVAKLVRYVNGRNKYDVRLWTIGNEPDKDYRTGALESYIQKWRTLRDAMKAVSPQILVFGPELAFAYNPDEPNRDWLTPFLRANGDVVDAVSLHRYPFNGTQGNPTVIMRDALSTGQWVRQLREHIRNVTGRDIPLVFTETNLSSSWTIGGEGGSQSFRAGMWLAETLGQMAESGVTMVNVWSAVRDGTISIIGDTPDQKRPTYYALLLYATYGDRVVPLASHVENVTAHASRSTGDGTVTVVLINRGYNEANLQLVFNSGEEQKVGGIYFDLDSLRRINWKTPGLSMSSLTFDRRLKLLQTIVYTRAQYDAQQPPRVSE